MFRRFFSDLLFAVFPETCVVCKQHLRNSEKVLCTSCLLDIPRIYFHNQERNPLEDLLWGHIPFVRASSFFYYSKNNAYANLLHDLKYKKRSDIGLFMGELFAAELYSSGFLQDIDAIISVPLHKKRQQKRGYNQSEEIAKGIAHITAIPIITDSIKRVKHTETQTKKSKEERLENMNNIFSVTNPEILANKHIVLIDDVITTGATCISCANTILTSTENTQISIISLGLVH